MAEDSHDANIPATDRFSALWRRLKEHRIAQWTVGYVAIAYGIQHAVTLTSEAYKWPDQIIRISMTLLALGLPIAMVFAWYHGERASRRVSAGEFSILSVLIFGVSILFYAFVRPAEPSLRTAPAEARTDDAGAPAGNALAVLPLANVSGDKDQEFFSDGMTDEIMSALTKIPSLRVLARESAFAFKGKSQDVRTVGRALGARYLVEGSVRKAGDRVRITAQLVRADDGVSLWTENYDRELKDVFAVQEDVARAIAASLRAPLGLKQGQSLVSNRNIDPDSYQQYLLARSLARARSMDQVFPILNSLVERNPEYAPASALLAYMDFLQAEFFTPALRTGTAEEAGREMKSLLDNGDTAARRAVAADPNHAFAYGALASIGYAEEKWADADDLFRKALTIDPNDPEILQANGFLLDTAGYLKRYLAIGQKQRTLEPFVPVYGLTLGGALQLNGRTAESVPIMESLPPTASFGFYRNVFLARTYADGGRFADAAGVLLLSPYNAVTRQSVEDAAKLLSRAPNAGKPETLPALQGELNFVYPYVGAPDRVMDFAERIANIGYMTSNVSLILWHSSVASVRKTERFKQLMRKIGLVDYWRAKGWPDLCHPVGADDFACE